MPNPKQSTPVAGVRGFCLSLPAPAAGVFLNKVTMMKFNSSEFTATDCSTADEKAKFCNQFAKLVENGFRQSDFPKWFYNRLTMTFGHIAHYNQGGFWETQLGSLPRQIAFLEQAIEWPCYGSPAFTYCDAERAIQGWLSDNRNILDSMLARLASACEARDRAQYEALKARFEPAAA